MKYFSPFALALLLTACAITPVDPQAARLHQLEKEARENFIAMKAQEHPGRPVVLHDDAPAATPAPRLVAFQGQPQPAPTPAPRAKTAFQTAAKPRATPASKPSIAAQPTPRHAPTPAPPSYLAAQPAPQSRTPRNNDETVYYWQVPSSRQRTTPREQAAEAKYARKLAKRPEELTPEERLWAHEHF